MKLARKNTMKGFLLFLLGTILVATQVIQAQQIDIGIFESTTPSKIEIYMKPDFDISGSWTMTNIQYTVRWTDASVSIVTDYISPYSLVPQGPPVLNAGYYYQIFATVPFAPVGTDISAGDEVLISSFTYSGAGSSCDSYEIINDSWTASNNGDVYFELPPAGGDVTGIIYEPIVSYGSVGGFVAGGCTIPLCQSTGTLTLTDYDGTINKWQKRVDCCTWIDIENTSDTYSEFPSCTGTWEYCVEVQKGSCPAVMSIPAVVIVDPPANIWTGTTDTDWFKPSNWTVGVPNTTRSGIIPAAPANQPQISNLTLTAEANDLTIEFGAVLSIETDGFLTVLGTLSNATGNSGLIIRSDATRTGSLIHSTAGVAATAQQYINRWSAKEKGIENGWHFLSSPVSAQPIRPEFIPLGNPLPTEIDFYKWDEDHVGSGCIGCWINTKDDAGNWNTSFEDDFVVGEGYLVAYTAPYGDVAKDFVGQVNVDNVTKTNLSHTVASTFSGWHLVGNPFASAIDWTAGSWVKTNFGAIPQIWEELAASYELIDNIGGDNSIIPAHNGFMVYTDTDNNNTLTIPIDARVHSDHFWYKADIESIRLLAHDLDKGLRQQTTIRQNIDATTGFDLQYDSYFIEGFAPMFYSVNNEECYALNSIPEFENSTSIPLDFINNGSFDFSIELENGPIGLDIFLNDLKLDIITNLLEESVYEFTSYAGDDPHRFLLSFNSVGIGEHETGKDVSVWYSNNQLYIDNKINTQNHLMIYSSMGQLLQKENFSGAGTHKFELSFPTGIYIARIISKGETTSVKFFID